MIGIFRKKFLIVLFSVCFFLTPAVVFARLGVGVGIGKIQVDQKLESGGVYKLPSLPVINTGDEETNYEVAVEFHQNQPQLMPAKDWFQFRPKELFLKPGEAESVEVILNLPLKTIPGDYFAYLEAHPIKKSVAGTTTIGIAAAAKLYFTVVPASFIQGIYYKVAFFFSRYSPWTWIVFGLIILVIIIAIVKKNFSFQLGIRKK